MGGAFELTTKGTRKLNRKLRRLVQRDAKRAVRRGVRAGTKPIRDKARRNARDDVGGDLGKLIAKHIKAMVYKRQKKGSFAMAVGLSASGNAELVETTKDGFRNYIPAAIEYGHAHPFAGGGRSAPKDVVAIPFMRIAHAETADIAIKTAERSIWKEIEQAAKKR